MKAIKINLKDSSPFSVCTTVYLAYQSVKDYSNYIQSSYISLFNRIPRRFLVNLQKERVSLGASSNLDS